MKKLGLVFICLLRLNGVFGETVSVLEGNSVSLPTGVTEIRKVYLMWLYGSSIIAKLDGETQKVSLYDVEDEIFEDRLQLDNQTGDLTISDIRTKHSGSYQLKIISHETSIKMFRLTVQDVFFAGAENRREGDSFTLNTGVTEIKKHDLMVWMFGPSNPDALLAKINIKIPNISYGSDERFRDRLNLDNQTGSVTVRDTKTTDSGIYQLQISNSKETIYKRFNVFVAAADPGLSAGFIALISAAVLLFVAGVSAVIYYRYKYSSLKDELKTVSVMEGDSVTLKTGVTEIQKDHEIIWRFGSKGPVIAHIQKNNNNFSFGDDERFRNKLHVDCETGDLTISDIRIRISGDYHLEIRSSTRITKSKRFKVVVRVDTMKVTEGESVHLHTGLSDLQREEEILWRFESKSKADGMSNENLLSSDDERFRSRLQMDCQTGSLTITNIKTSDSGVYQLQIKSRNTSLYKKFNVLVWFNTLKCTVGDSVTLHTGVPHLRADDRILWMFGDKDTSIAELNRVRGQVSVYEGNDERFRDRLKLNEQNGDLTIRNISRGHSDVYKLQIIIGEESTCKRFMLIAHEKLESVNEGESVTLHTDVTDTHTHDLILWMFGPEDNLIAKGDTERKILYDGADGRFRDKLQLDQTGSLTITNIHTTHTGVYKLQIISNTETKYKKFRVSVRERDRTHDITGAESEGIPLLPISN